MIDWLGYAEIRFDQSAHLALARAVEQSGSEALASMPDAWLVEDRTVTLNVEVDTARGEMVAMKRLLTALLLEAEQGEAVIEVPPFERWSREAGPAPSRNYLFASDTEVGVAPITDLDRATIMSSPRPRETPRRSGPDSSRGVDSERTKSRERTQRGP